MGDEEKIMKDALTKEYEKRIHDKLNLDMERMSRDPPKRENQIKELLDDLANELAKTQTELYLCKKEMKRTQRS